MLECENWRNRATTTPTSYIVQHTYVEDDGQSLRYILEIRKKSLPDNSAESDLHVPDVKIFNFRWTS